MPVVLNATAFVPSFDTPSVTSAVLVATNVSCQRLADATDLFGPLLALKVQKFEAGFRAGVLRFGRCCAHGGTKACLTFVSLSYAGVHGPLLCGHHIHLTALLYK